MASVSFCWMGAMSWFCWRPTATDSSNIPAGIVYYDPATKKIVRYSESTDLGLGICINPNKTKLF